jgi:hypothetical protein
MIENDLIQRPPSPVQDPFGDRLSEAMGSNQYLLMTAESLVSGDSEAACRLIGIEHCADPKPAPSEQRMAAYLILFTYQQRLFGGITLPNESPYILANTSADTLVLVQTQPDETRTTLHITAAHGRIGVNKIKVNYFANLSPTNALLNTNDMEVMDRAAVRLERVNRAWRRLIHGPRP